MPSLLLAGELHCWSYDVNRLTNGGETLAYMIGYIMKNGEGRDCLTWAKFIVRNCRNKCTNNDFRDIIGSFLD